MTIPTNPLKGQTLRILARDIHRDKTGIDWEIPGYGALLLLDEDLDDAKRIGPNAIFICEERSAPEVAELIYEVMSVVDGSAAKK